MKFYIRTPFVFCAGCIGLTSGDGAKLRVLLVVAGLGIALLQPCSSQAQAQPDYFLTSGAAFICPFGEERQNDSHIGFDFVSVPPVVLPGQQVPVQLQWSFLNPNNPNAVIYLNAFGDWQPGTELARLVNGELVGGTKTVGNSFGFTAPPSPGHYRIRIPFVEAFSAVTNFYGAPRINVNYPGYGSYAEVAFSVAPPVQDYFLTSGAAFICPFGEGRQNDSHIGFDFVSVPPVVLPGQQVPVQLQWSFLNPNNPNAVIYLNAFGDWQPGTELARLVNGELVGGTKTVSNSFSFTAPSSPGLYRIRIPFVEAFSAVTNFYGGPRINVNYPGYGSYAEVAFRVSIPPVQDYFLTSGAAFICPFGEGRQNDSHIGFDFVSVPPVVLPGQQVPVQLQWSFLNPNNPNAVIYLNAFGDWQPGTELARPVNAELVGGTKTVSNSFSFTAPSSPGLYRIRIPFVEAFSAVTNFYGGPRINVNYPGYGSYAEIAFRVSATPPIVQTNSLPISLTDYANRPIVWDTARKKAYIPAAPYGPIIVNTLDTLSIDRVLTNTYNASVDLSPDGKRLYARRNCAPNSDGVRVFDASTYESLNLDYCNSYTPWTILASAQSNDIVYMTEYYAGAVAKVNISAGTVLGTIDVGPWPVGLAFDASRRFLYVGQGDPGVGWTSDVAIKVIDTTTDTVTATIPLNGEPGLNLELSQDGGYLYVTTRNAGTERLYRISTTDHSARTLDLPGVAGAGHSLSPDGRCVYVAHESGNLVHIIDTVSMTQIGTISVPHPKNFSVSPDGLHAIAVSEQDSLLYYFTFPAPGITSTSPPLPMLQAVTRTAGAFSLVWSAIPGRIYQIQYKKDLDQLWWNNLGGLVTATNWTATASDNTAGNMRRFYRVVFLP